MEGDRQHPAQLAIGGEDRGTLVFWYTGGNSTWAWDRMPVVLEKGPNTIELVSPEPVRIGHLNVLPGGAAAQARSASGS